MIASKDEYLMKALIKNLEELNKNISDLKDMELIKMTGNLMHVSDPEDVSRASLKIEHVMALIKRKRMEQAIKGKENQNE